MRFPAAVVAAALGLDAALVVVAAASDNFRSVSCSSREPAREERGRGIIN